MDNPKSSTFTVGSSNVLDEIVAARPVPPREGPEWYVFIFRTPGKQTYEDWRGILAHKYELVQFLKDEGLPLVVCKAVGKSPHTFRKEVSLGVAVPHWIRSELALPEDLHGEGNYGMEIAGKVIKCYPVRSSKERVECDGFYTITGRCGRLKLEALCS